MTTTINLSPFPHLTLLPSLHPHPTLPFPFPAGPRLQSTAFSIITHSKPRRRPLIHVSALRPLVESYTVPVAAVVEGMEEVTSGAGVYAVYDGKDELQFIGISRNVKASVEFHRRAVPDLCVSVKLHPPGMTLVISIHRQWGTGWSSIRQSRLNVGVVDDPNREALTEAWKSWMEAHIAATGKVPPGNENGNTTWVRPPPKTTKADLRLTPGRHVELTVPLEQLIDRLVKENKVVAFIKGSRWAPQCGFSQRVIGLLESQGVDYESIDVLDEEYNYGLRETLKKYSNWPTFPQIFVKGELVGGCDILTSLLEKGELSSLLKG